MVDERNLTRHAPLISPTERAAALGYTGATVWLTGFSGSGKSTVATEIERMVVGGGRPAWLLDGDNLRQGLNGDLGFSAEDRAENVRRVAEVACLFAAAGVVALVPLISPFREGRDAARTKHVAEGLRFVEVFVDTPLEECEARDPKGLYAKARAGQIKGFTGIDDPYEAPLHPELVLRPSDGDAADMAASVVNYLKDNNL